MSGALNDHVSEAEHEVREASAELRDWEQAALDYAEVHRDCAMRHAREWRDTPRWRFLRRRAAARNALAHLADCEGWKEEADRLWRLMPRRNTR